VRAVVTEVGWDGSIRRSALETAGQPDARHWDHLIEQVLVIPPMYRAAPGSSVYVIHAGDRAVLVGEHNLTGALHELVSTVLQTGNPALAAKQPTTATIAYAQHLIRHRHGKPASGQPSHP
jgi:hypothetical protein